MTRPARQFAFLLYRTGEHSRSIRFLLQPRKAR